MIYLTPFQVKKYNETGILVLTKNALKKPNYEFKLSQAQIKSLQSGEKVTITTKTGGFIPLIPLIAGVGTAISAATSIYNSVQNKKTNGQLVEQKIRQNDILERQNREGKPIQVNTLSTEATKLGGALTQKKVVSCGNSGGALTQTKVISGGSLSCQKMDYLIRGY